MNISYPTNALNKSVAEAPSETPVSLEQSKRSSRQTGKQTDSGDTVSISDLARELFSTYQSSAPSRNDAPGATMKAITANGTEVTLEARSNGKKTFTMGQGLKAFTNDAHKKAYKTLTWNAQTESAETLEYIATFKKTNGEVSSFLLEGNTAFTEDKDGNLLIRKADPSGRLTGTDENDILFNIEDNGVIDAGSGDDIILSMGKNAVLVGGEGDDVITSMGDGAVIDGGAGDDAIAVLYDTLRHTMEQQEDNNDEKDLYKRKPYSQTVTVNGGDGNDDIMTRPELFKSTIKSGEGDDTLRLGNVTSSTVDAGNGENTMLMENVLHSTLYSGTGDDYVSIRKLSHSTLNVGDGNNKMLIDEVFSSTIISGNGDDVLTARSIKKSTVMLGAGVDTVNAVNIADSFFSGVEFVNAITVSNSIFKGVAENGFNVKNDLGNIVNGHVTGTQNGQDPNPREAMIWDRFITLEEKPEQASRISQTEKIQMDYTSLLTKMLIQ